MPLWRRVTLYERDALHVTGSRRACLLPCIRNAAAAAAVCCAGQSEPCVCHNGGQCCQRPCCAGLGGGKCNPGGSLHPLCTPDRCTGWRLMQGCRHWDGAPWRILAAGCECFWWGRQVWRSACCCKSVCASCQASSAAHLCSKCTRQAVRPATAHVVSACTSACTADVSVCCGNRIVRANSPFTLWMLWHQRLVVPASWAV